MNRRLERSILATALIAAIAYGVADENPGLLLLGVVSVLASWMIFRARGGRALPMSVTIPLTLAAVGYAMILLASEGFKVGVFSEFVLALIVVKLVDRRSARDNAQLLLLSVFLVVGAILTSNRLVLGLLILAFVPVFGTTVVQHQIESARQAASPAAVGRRSHASLQERADLRRLVWFSTLACLVISIGVFVIMPRGVGMQAFGAWGNTSLGQVTSFTDEVELGRGGLISQSSTPVLDLEVRNAQGETLGSASEVFYLRGAVLDEYDDGRWSRGSGRGDPLKQSASYVGANTPHTIGRFENFSGRESRLADHELRVTLRNARRGETHLFSLWRPIEIETLKPTDIKHDPTDGTIIRESRQSGKFEYLVRCRVGETRSGQRETAGPPPTFGSARITTLTQQILRNEDTPVDPDPRTRPLGDNFRAVRMIRSYLVENYAYSLETRTAPPGQDPIEWFLFGEDKRGHCEYFAAAMTAMCRSVGINARVVTGYVATEWNAPTGHYIVRESNAHAWVEVEVQPGLWQRRDPTPTTEFISIHEPSRSMVARLRRLMDTAEYAWINSVVGFSRRSRSGSMDAAVEGAFSGWAQSIGGRIRTGGVGLLVRAAGAGLIAFAGAAVLGFFAVWLARGPWRGAASRFSGVTSRLLGRASLKRSASTHETLRRELLALFQRLGRPKPAWRPLRAHAESLRDQAAFKDLDLPAASGVADTIYLERFGDKAIEPETASSAKDDLRSIARNARRARSRRARD